MGVRTNARARATELVYETTTIGMENFNGSRMVNLTDMWRAAGSPKNKEPSGWSRLPGTMELIDCLALNMGKSHIMKAAKGKGGGTWAIPNLAITYAKYLSPTFHAWANEAIIERLQEDANPELAIARSRARAAETWRRRGKSEEWIQRRIEGIGSRHKFTDTLKERGVENGVGYAVCTDAIYRPLLGGSTREVKIVRELGDRDNLRDHLDDVELASVSLSEALAAERIDGQELFGTNPCKDVCSESSRSVAHAVETTRRQWSADSGKFNR